MIYLFCYDFPSNPGGDRRRARVARRLENLGLRVQYSVFEIEMPPEKLPLVLSSLEEILMLEEDSLRIYPLCSTCNQKTIRFGPDAPCEHELLLQW